MNFTDIQEKNLRTGESHIMRSSFPNRAKDAMAARHFLESLDGPFPSRLEVDGDDWCLWWFSRNGGNLLVYPGMEEVQFDEFLLYKPGFSDPETLEEQGFTQFMPFKEGVMNTEILIRKMLSVSPMEADEEFYIH
jgi:hypothetical protein